MLQEFPKWKYHRTQPSRIVGSAEEEAGLGPEWANSPADFTEPAEVPPPPDTDGKKKKKGG